MLATYVYLRSLMVTLPHDLRTRRDERGQGTVEYLGLILLIAAVIVGIQASGLTPTVANGIKTVVTKAIETVTGENG